MLSAQSISVQLDDGFVPFRDLSLQLNEGELVVLSGLNGSGKTQLLRCLCGLSNPSRGSIYLDNDDLTKRPKLRMQAVRMVFQHADRQVLSYTVAEEIACGPRNLGLSESEVQTRTQEAISRFGLASRVDYHPAVLSGGELRRLALASIFAMQPRFILLDEPFGNLDYPALQSLLQAILALQQHGVGIVIATHELDKVMAHANTLWLMKQGRMCFQGSPADGLDTARTIGLYVPPLSIPMMSRLANAGTAADGR